MAQPSNGHIIGLDVSKATLDVFEWDTERAYSIANEAMELPRFRGRYSAWVSSSLLIIIFIV